MNLSKFAAALLLLGLGAVACGGSTGGGVTPGKKIAFLMPDAAPRYESQDLRTRVESALKCLPPRQREVLARYYGDSLTLRESALKMGISEARACQLHGRAIQNLRRLLAALVTPRVAVATAA